MSKRKRKRARNRISAANPTIKDDPTDTDEERLKIGSQSSLRVMTGEIRPAHVSAYNHKDDQSGDYFVAVEIFVNAKLAEFLNNMPFTDLNTENQEFVISSIACAYRGLLEFADKLTMYLPPEHMLPIRFGDTFAKFRGMFD